MQLVPAGTIPLARFSDEEWERLRQTRARIGWPSRPASTERPSADDPRARG